MSLYSHFLPASGAVQAPIHAPATTIPTSGGGVVPYGYSSATPLPQAQASAGSGVVTPYAFGSATPAGTVPAVQTGVPATQAAVAAAPMYGQMSAQQLAAQQAHAQAQAQWQQAYLQHSQWAVYTMQQQQQQYQLQQYHLFQQHRNAYAQQLAATTAVQPAVPPQSHQPQQQPDATPPLPPPPPPPPSTAAPPLPSSAPPPSAPSAANAASGSAAAAAAAADSDNSAAPWPRAVEDWVVRTLALKRPGNELSSFLAACKADGSLWSRDWASRKAGDFSLDADATATKSKTAKRSRWTSSDDDDGSGDAPATGLGSAANTPSSAGRGVIAVGAYDSIAARVAPMGSANAATGTHSQGSVGSTQGTSTGGRTAYSTAFTTGGGSGASASSTAIRQTHRLTVPPPSAASLSNAIPLGKRRALPEAAAGSSSSGSSSLGGDLSDLLKSIARKGVSKGAVAAASAKAGVKLKSGGAPTFKPTPSNSTAGGLQLLFGQEEPLTEADWDRLTIRGTSTSMLKRYFRLITPPSPETVRPQPLLELALQHVVEAEAKGADYRAFVNDQLKSIRQDLVVQCIRNDFTVRAYEAHARIALRHRDGGEFNQCQTQLAILYARGLPGASREFIAYRLLYYVYSRSATDAVTLLARMTADERHDPAIAHALAVRQAAAVGDYHTLFQLYRAAPNLGALVMDLFAHTMRISAAIRMAEAYRPSVPLAFVAAELAFPSVADCRRVLTEAGAVIGPGADANAVWDTKASSGGRMFVTRERTAEEAAQAALVGAQADQVVADGDDDAGAGDDDADDDGGDVVALDEDDMDVGAVDDSR